MEYILIGVLAAAFGVMLTLFLNKLGLWKKNNDNGEER